jgi:hypothetical protein
MPSDLLRTESIRVPGGGVSIGDVGVYYQCGHRSDHTQCRSLAAPAVARIQADPDVVTRLGGLNVRAVAASLTWLGERLYSLADVPPFNDRDTLSRSPVLYSGFFRHH